MRFRAKIQMPHFSNLTAPAAAHSGPETEPLGTVQRPSWDTQCIAIRSWQPGPLVAVSAASFCTPSCSCSQSSARGIAATILLPEGFRAAQPLNGAAITVTEVLSALHTLHNGRA